jgi:hypothetical protein
MLTASLYAAVPARADDPLERVTPYVNDQTMVVARVDVTRVDMAQAIQWFKTLMLADSDAPIAPDRDRADALAADLDQAAAVLGGMRQVFLDAGASEIFVVWSMTDVPPGLPVFVISTTPTTNLDVLRGVLASLGIAPPPEVAEQAGFSTQYFVSQREASLVIATTSSLQKMHNSIPADTDRLHQLRGACRIRSDMGRLFIFIRCPTCPRRYVAYSAAAFSIR